MKQTVNHSKGTHRGKAPPPPKAKAPAKAPAKAAPAPKAPAYPFTHADVIGAKRGQLVGWVKTVFGQEPNYDVPEYALRHLLTLILNGSSKEDAKAATVEMVKRAKANAEPAPAAKGNGKSVPVHKPAPPTPKHSAPHPPTTSDPAPRREAMRVPPVVVREPVKAEVPGTATSIAEYPVDYLIEAIVERLMKPFLFFFASLVENEKEKKSDAALQKVWDKHFPGYRVAEIRDGFNARLSTLRVPPALAREVPSVFNTF